VVLVVKNWAAYLGISSCPSQEFIDFTPSEFIQQEEFITIDFWHGHADYEKIYLLLFSTCRRI